jgi:hypothetical protein
VRVVLATHALNVVGGTETYLLTVADNLVRLGHEVVAHAPRLGPMSDVFRDVGATVVLADALPGECDGLLVNEVATAYAMAEHYPGQPQVFVAHSALFDAQIPPLLPVPGSICVVMNDRLAARVAALATPGAPLEVVRLRQPIDSVRLAPRGEPAVVPRRVLLLSNYLTGPALAALEGACDAVGLELTRTGSLTAATYDVASAVAHADIVVGKARAVLDGMSCGRPVLVFDAFGGDGWVTPASYPQLEADGFAGQSQEQVYDAEGLAAALREYDPAMGQANRELILKHHQDRKHAEALVGLFHRAALRPPAPVSHSGELSRLAALRWRAEQEAVRLRQEVATLSAEVRRLEQVVIATQDRARRRARAARKARAELERRTGAPPEIP